MDSNNDKQVGGDHYRKKNFVQQHWDYAWDHDYDQFQYCITKYVDRHKDKNGLEDLYKARHHLDKYIGLLEAEETKKEVGSAFEDAADRAVHWTEEDQLPREYVNPDL